MASVASQLIEEVTAHAQSDSLEDAREICADGTYFPNTLRTSRKASVLRRPWKASVTSIHCKRDTRNGHYRVHFKLSRRDHTAVRDIHCGG